MPMLVTGADIFLFSPDGIINAKETASAQQLKAQFGSTRIQLMQFYIAEWISEALRIKAEIICKHFQPETIIERSNVMRTPDAPFAQAAIALLKDEHVSQYRIKVEADSMAAMDWAAERDAAVQFMNGLGAFISQVAPMAQQVPEAGPYLMRMMQWAVSKFRVSTQIESILDQAVAGMQQKLQTPPPPPQPDPDTVIKAQIEQAKIQSAEKIAMMEAQSDQQIASLKASVELQKIEMKAALDGVTQQYQQIMQAMNTTGQMAPQLEQLAGAVAQLAQGSAQSNEMSAMQMQTLMDRLSRKTKRVPIRDENGDIVEVREVEDDAPDGMAMLPQPQGAMNAGFVG